MDTAAKVKTPRQDKANDAGGTRIAGNGISLPAVQVFERKEIQGGRPQTNDGNGLTVQTKPSPPISPNAARTNVVQNRFVAEPKADDNEPIEQQQAFQLKADYTGLPPALKAGTEQLSGFKLDDVKVHYNSDKPAQLQALAFAQGSDIHIGQGQERHLPHEAWHVVQQKQGRVQPTVQLKQIAEQTIANALVVQMASREDAQKRLGLSEVSKADDVVVRAIVSLDHLSRLIPDVENALVPYTDFVSGLPTGEIPQLNGVDKGSISRSIGGTVANIKKRLAILVTELESIEATYVEMRQDDSQLKELYDLAAADLDLFNSGIIIFTLALPAIEKLFSVAYEKRDHFDGNSGILRAVSKYLDKLTKSGGGGFSALGRANDMDVAIGTAPVDAKNTKDESYINANTGMDGDAVNATAAVYKDPKNMKIAAKGPIYYNQQTHPDTLTDVKNPQEWTFTSAPSPKDRGEGQFSAMGGWNAKAYAGNTKTEGWETTSWEWLHLRASSLGGDTKPTNLILGTRDANTHMMPFESNVRMLVQIASSLGLNVYIKWEAKSQVAKHKFKFIDMEWQFKEKEAQTEGMSIERDAKGKGTARFDVLNTSSSISKLEIAHIEKWLKESRNKLRPKEEEE